MRICPGLQNVELVSVRVQELFEPVICSGWQFPTPQPTPSCTDDRHCSQPVSAPMFLMQEVYSVLVNCRDFWGALGMTDCGRQNI